MMAFWLHLVGITVGFWWFGPWFIVPGLLMTFYQSATGFGFRIGKS
jgi:hypothetical protein